MGKHAVSRRDLKPNENLKYEDIKFLRTGQKGLNRHEISFLIKKKSFFRKKVKKNLLIKANYLSN